jgi:hypothetical protein
LKTSLTRSTLEVSSIKQDAVYLKKKIHHNNNNNKKTTIKSKEKLKIRQFKPGVLINRRIEGFHAIMMSCIIKKSGCWSHAG